MAIARAVFSSATDGFGIMICATDSTIPGQTIHSGPSTTTAHDEIYIYAVNNHTACNVGLTIEFGSTASQNNITQFLAPESGLFLVVPGLTLRGFATNRVITAFATLSGVVSVFGNVNRIT